jgi:hypothetical protein
MQTFRGCRRLHSAACSIGKKKALEAGGIELLLDAVNNLLLSAKICQYAMIALDRVIDGGKESTELFISVGGVTVVS